MEEEQKKKLIKWFIVGIVIILILWFATLILSKTNQSKKGLTAYIDEEAKYQISSTKITSILPVIKLEGNDAKEVNAIIRGNYNTAIRSKYTQFTYQASVSKKYLSIALITNYAKPTPHTTVDTYTFNIKTGKRIYDNELLEKFSTNWNVISTSFEKEMQKFYEEELRSMYFTKSECDYQCFLENRGIASYQDDLHLFISNDKLMYYRPFLVFSSWGEEDFYRHQNFAFEIK